MTATMIELRDFSIGYGDRMLLRNANTTIGSHCLTALIGRNGAGKSTLLKAIAGLNNHFSGEILIEGKNIRTLQPQHMARQLAFVTTGRTRISNLHCENVVAMGRAPYTNWIGRMQAADREIVKKSLDAVGMASYARRTMDTMSDGECQRIMIARALAQATPVILLDEPTSFLDMPFSTHELDIALSLADNIALIDSPALHCMSADDMRRSGHIEQLFRNGSIAFDAATGKIVSNR